ncbi:MAG TPA: serine protein kinase RIO [Methanomicrobiales archaeon]|nr:serine protein kinase RIO [Methanomicrobiales archaeon]
MEEESEDRGDRKEKGFDRRIAELGIRIKDADQWKVRDDVFDEVTLLALYRLVHKKHLTTLGGPISTGKEGNVFYGEKDGKPLAIKIYLIRTANFRAMTEYIDGDPRFSHVRRSRKEIIFAWTRKEFSNLKRARKAGVPVPEPYSFDRNILLMEFLGEGQAPFPQIREVELPDPGATYREIVGYIEALFSRARLVHGDLSEYNVLFGDRPVLIDMGQAVTLDHPRALQFLVRDIANINRFFSDKCEVMGEREIFQRIAGERLAGP